MMYIGPLKISLEENYELVVAHLRKHGVPPEKVTKELRRVWMEGPDGGSEGDPPWGFDEAWRICEFLGVPQFAPYFADEELRRRAWDVLVMAAQYVREKEKEGGAANGS